MSLGKFLCLMCPNTCPLFNYFSFSLLTSGSEDQFCPDWDLDILGVKEREECSLQQPNRLEQHVVFIDDWCLGSKGEMSRKLVSEVGWALYWSDRSPQSHPPTEHRFLVAFGKNSVKRGLFGIWQAKASSVSSYTVGKGLLLFLKLEEMAKSPHHFFSVLLCSLLWIF